MRGLARAVKASIVGRAQGDYEYWLRASETAPTTAGALRCLVRAAEARAILDDADPGYFKRRLALL